MDKRKFENKMFVNTRKVPLHGLGPGGEIPIEVDKEGTPIDQKWRRRLKDEDIKLKKPVKKAGK
jgi:hypothetical protein